MSRLPWMLESSCSNVLSTGARGRVVCPSATRQRRGRTPRRRGLCSSRGRTRAQEPSSGPTRKTRSRKSDLGSWPLATQQKQLDSFPPTCIWKPVVGFSWNVTAELSKPVCKYVFMTCSWHHHLLINELCFCGEHCCSKSCTNEAFPEFY